LQCEIMLDCGEFDIYLSHAGLVPESEQFGIEPHSHHFYEIHYIDQGRGISYLNRNSEQFALTKGMAYFAKPGEVHAQYSIRHQPLRIYYIGFDVRMKPSGNLLETQELIGILEQAANWHENAYSLKPIFARILNEVASKSFGSKYAIKGAFLDMLAEIVRMQHTGGRSDFDRVSLDHKHTLDEAIHYLNNHLHLPLTPERLSNQFNMSESHFRRLFKQFMGISVGEYVRSRKIAYAQQLLRSQYSIKEVAQQLGYKSPELFSKSFKKMTGCSPQQFKFPL